MGDLPGLVGAKVQSESCRSQGTQFPPLYDAFNGVYRTYFKMNYPARAFIGASKLLFGSRFEVLGIAVKKGP